MIMQSSKVKDLKLFEIYKNELLIWNDKYNLTAITEPSEIWQKHFEDSLTVAKAFDFSKGNPLVIDVGTGAGFPGLPLKIKFPNIKLTLLDSAKKKIDFLEHIVNILRLDNVDIVCERAENFARRKREFYDLAVSRAVSDLKILSELSLPFVKIGGKFIAMKAKNVEAEARHAENAIRILCGKMDEIIDVSLNNLSRKLVVISKINNTPIKYPRRAGLPNKRPLR